MVGVEDEDEDEEGVWGHVVCSPPSLILAPAPVITMSLSAPDRCTVTRSQEHSDTDSRLPCQALGCQILSVFNLHSFLK